MQQAGFGGGMGGGGGGDEVFVVLFCPLSFNQSFAGIAISVILSGVSVSQSETLTGVEGLLYSQLLPRVRGPSTSFRSGMTNF